MSLPGAALLDDSQLAPDGRDDHPPEAAMSGQGGVHHLLDAARAEQGVRRNLGIGGELGSGGQAKVADGVPGERAVRVVPAEAGHDDKLGVLRLVAADPRHLLPGEPLGDQDRRQRSLRTAAEVLTDPVSADDAVAGEKERRLLQGGRLVWEYEQVERRRVVGQDETCPVVDAPAPCGERHRSQPVILRQRLPAPALEHLELEEAHVDGADGDDDETNQKQCAAAERGDLWREAHLSGGGVGGGAASGSGGSPRRSPPSASTRRR